MTDGYDAICFDNDGVLVEPTARDALLSAVRSTFRAHGVDDPAFDHVESMLAGVTVDHIERCCTEYGIEDAEAFWRQRDREASRVQREEIRAGRKPLYDDVAALESIDLPLGIVSNNQQPTIEFIVDHYGLADRFRTAYGREMTLDGLRRKKPEPYYLRRALSDLDAEQALFVGDSAVDVQAAHAAGIDSVFIRRSHREDEDLAVEPTHEIAGLDELPDVL